MGSNVNVTGYIPSDAIVAANDIVLHEYATGEDLTLENPKLLVGGNPTEAYRVRVKTRHLFYWQ